MTNNEILRNLRFTFNFDDSKMISVFALAESQVTRHQISQWMKKDEDPDFVGLTDTQLATFLNGLINDKRGKKDGPQPTPESKLTNNIVFRKLKIALDLKSDDVIDVLKLADLRVSSHELTAFFRKPEHKNYRPCKNQILRNFLKGLQLKYRPTT